MRNEIVNFFSLIARFSGNILMECKRKRLSVFSAVKCLMAGGSLWLMLLSSANAEALKAFSVETVQPDYLHTITANFNKELTCCETRFSPEHAVMNKGSKPTYRLSTLFSSQQGSWMFQSFVNNGLFKVASRYQPHHPKALMITKGEADLEWLYRNVNDHSILAKEGSRYRLSYPLIIGEKAKLIVTGHLELNAASGAALINLGTLVVNHAVIASEGDNDALFRPFITAWNGSETYIYQSEITGLGYDAYLSQGVSVVHRADASLGSVAWIEVVNSRLVGLESGLVLSGGRGVVSGNDIIDAKSYGIDADSSSLLIEDNSISNTALNSGIRLQSPFSTEVRKNKVEHSQKAGISVSGRIGQLKIIGNQLLYNQGSGVLVEAADSEREGIIQLQGNIIAHNEQSGIRANCVTTCQINKNLFLANKQYAISFGNSHQFPDHLLLITGNSFSQSKNELVQTSELQHLIFGGNKLALNAGTHSVFSGELQSIQSDILRSTLTHNDTVDIKALH